MVSEYQRAVMAEDDAILKELLCSKAFKIDYSDSDLKEDKRKAVSVIIDNFMSDFTLSNFDDCKLFAKKVLHDIDNEFDARKPTTWSELKSELYNSDHVKISVSVSDIVYDYRTDMLKALIRLSDEELNKVVK